MIRRISGALAVALLLASCGGERQTEAERALAEGREQDAWLAANRAVAADSASAEAWRDLARAALRTLRAAQGAPAAERALELAPADWRVLVVKSGLDQARFRNVAAVAAAEQAVALAPEEPRAWRALGEVRLGGGMVGTADPEGSAAAFREALRLGDPQEPRATLGLAVALMLDGNHAEARSYLDTVIAATEASAEAYYQRGLARMRERDHEGAVEDFRRAVRREPGHEGGWFNLGRLLPRLGFPDEAKDALARGREARARAEQAHSLEITWFGNGDLGAGLQLAAAWRRAGRLDRSLLLAETLAIDSPRVPPTHLELAETLLALGRPAEAAEAVDRALVLNPGSPRARIVRAWAALEAGDPEGALERLGPAEEAAPEALALIGRAWIATDRLREGARALSFALRANPRRTDWLLARAQARLTWGAVGPAAEDLRLVLAIDPGQVEACERLAALREEQGRAEEARELRAVADSVATERAAGRRAEEERWRTDFLVP